MTGRRLANFVSLDSLPGLFATSLLVGFSGALMPGPLLAAVIAGAAAGGFWMGPALVLGHGLLEVGAVLAIAGGLGRALARPRVMRAIAVVGGLLLLWMAFGMVRDGLAQRVVLGGAGATALPAAPVLTGALVSAANPYWLLWWATAGAGYLALSLRHGLAGPAAFFAGHILSDLSWYSAVALAVASGRELLGPAAYNGIVAGAGAFLAVMGVTFLAYRPGERPAQGSSASLSSVRGANPYFSQGNH